MQYINIYQVKKTLRKDLRTDFRKDRRTELREDRRKDPLRKDQRHKARTPQWEARAALACLDERHDVRHHEL